MRRASNASSYSHFITTRRATYSNTGATPAPVFADVKNNFGRRSGYGGCRCRRSFALAPFPFASSVVVAVADAEGEGRSGAGTLGSSAPETAGVPSGDGCMTAADVEEWAL